MQRHPHYQYPLLGDHKVSDIRDADTVLSLDPSLTMDLVLVYLSPTFVIPSLMNGKALKVVTVYGMVIDGGDIK